MSILELETALIDDGLPSTHFFNGRILSREDMQREQRAGRAFDQRLGLALGDGVVRGLEVKKAASSTVEKPVVRVESGLALNRLGQSIALTQAVEVSLLKPLKPTLPLSPQLGGFGSCLPESTEVYVSGTGVYLLTVAPAQVSRGLALVSGLGNQSAPCNAQETVECAQFRLLQVKLTSDDLLDEPTLRNRVAYKFFFSEAAGDQAWHDPFGPTPPPPPSLTDPLLSEGEVPLSILYWTSTGGIQFIDMWAVRRRALPRSAEQSSFLDPRGHGRLGSAMRCQFQAHIEDLRGVTASSIMATDVCRYLPPVGCLPLRRKSGSPDFDHKRFFQRRLSSGDEPLTVRGPLFLEAAQVSSLMAAGVRYPPVDLKNPVMFWQYLVRENQQTLAGRPPTVPYVIFATGYMPCHAEARFDVSRYDYSNYTIR